MVTGDVAEKIAELKRQPGKSIQIPGSPTLVQATLRYGLLDELTLMIAPIVVAFGMRLFDEITNSVGLELADSRALGGGVLSVTYRLCSIAHNRGVRGETVGACWNGPRPPERTRRPASCSRC